MLRLDNTVLWHDAVEYPNLILFTGASLGTIFGTIIWGIGKLSGTSIKDTQDMLYQMKVKRDQ